MRLSQYLAHAGVASRRGAEKLIEQGRVQVNGETVTAMGTQVTDTDAVCFDGRPVAPQTHQYFLFYKPQRVMCTSHDPQGRDVVLDYFKDITQRLYTVGRLDYMSEGLLIVTNDGELANRLTHPRYETEKEYEVVIDGDISQEAVFALRRGVMLSDGVTAPAAVRRLISRDGRSALAVTIREGRNRQVRRMLEAVGHRVVRLKRVRVGSLTLTGVEYGGYRPLTQSEIDYLKGCAVANEKNG